MREAIIYYFAATIFTHAPFMISTRSDSALRPRSALILILIGGAFVRLYGIYDYLPTMDEIQFFIISQGDSFAEIWRRAQAEVHPPLAWFIRHFTLMLSADVFVQRLFSVAAGLLTIVATYALGEEVYRDRSAGLFCALCMAFIPSAVIASIGLRNYAFFMLFMTWALVFFVRWQVKNKMHNLVLYSLFMLLACSVHFSGFLVAAAIGIACGLTLLLTKRLRLLLIFCVSYLPLAVLGVVFYLHYLAPGTTIPMWKTFMLETGFTPAHPETGFVPQLVIPLLAYFSPFLQAVHSEGFIPASLQTFAQVTVLSGGIFLLIICAASLYTFRNISKDFLSIVVSLWVIALALSVAGIYPFSANRHNIYLLPFFILPLASLSVRSFSDTILTRSFLIIMIFSSIAVNESVIWQDEDFCLKRDDFNQAQSYLHSHLEKGDAIVTGPMGAYFYLHYFNDKGKTPYNDYTDVNYYNDTTLLAPFASPYKPYSNWRPFRDNLAQRLQEGKAQGGNVWFVQYGWKNQELWFLMNCKTAHPLMQNFMSREGVVIFSIKTDALSDFLKDSEAWETCYAGYKPLVVGTPFHALYLEGVR